MGRPIQKRQIQAGSGRIQVTSAYFTGDGAATDTNVNDKLYIENQRSSRKFTVKNLANSEVLTLVGKATPAEGEFCIQCILDDSTVVYVTRLHNRTVSVQEDNDPTTLQHIPFTRLTEATDEGQVSNKANIDVQ